MKYHSIRFNDVDKLYIKEEMDQGIRGTSSKLAKIYGVHFLSIHGCFRSLKKKKRLKTGPSNGKTDSQQCFDTIENNDIKRVIKNYMKDFLINKLTDQQRSIWLYYVGDGSFNQSKTGKLVGLSHSRIGQICQTVKNRLANLPNINRLFTEMCR